MRKDEIHPSIILTPFTQGSGAYDRAAELVTELEHPNRDWKVIVDGIRQYLFNNLYKLGEDTEPIVELLCSHLLEALSRKKMSSIRAVETFFDRYEYITARGADGDEGLIPAQGALSLSLKKFIDEMILVSEEEFYFQEINSTFVKMLGNSTVLKTLPEPLAHGLLYFLFLQYGLYIKQAIVLTPEEGKRLTELMKGAVISSEKLFGTVTSSYYNDRLSQIQTALTGQNPLSIRSLLDFTQNAAAWKIIAVELKEHISSGVITEKREIEDTLIFLVTNAGKGNDRSLQFYMSGVISDICNSLVNQNRSEHLMAITDLLLPQLFKSIEEGAFYASFSIIESLGKAVLKSRKSYIIDHFIQTLIQSNFSFPEYGGIDADWSIMVNENHLTNIRTWLELIKKNPTAMRNLAASLIVNLKLGGVFLKDTDIFQKDISSLLNSDYEDVFYIVTTLAGVFPAFFHDIGATGKIRTYTEKIDTNHKMNDLIHFIRKQVHVESSNRTVDLIQRVMEFWMTGDITLLKHHVPEEVYTKLPDYFMLVNLDNDDNAQLIVEGAKKQFPEYKDLRFWDFLQAVGEEKFFSFCHSCEEDEDLKLSVRGVERFFKEYYETQIPTEMTKIFHYIKNIFGINISETKIWKFVYEIDDDEFRKLFENVREREVSTVNIEKFITFLHVYRMIYDKYNFSDIRTVDKLKTYAEFGLFEPPGNFFQSLSHRDPLVALQGLLEVQEQLKEDVLLSKEHFEPQDTVYYKRHIAFGIPSMFGYYKEKKFDTLRVFFQMNMIRLGFFEKVISSCAGSQNQWQDFELIRKLIKLFLGSYSIDGLATRDIHNAVALLETPNLKLSQLRDIISTILSLHGEISDTFNSIFRYVTRTAIHNIGVSRIRDQYKLKEEEDIDIITDRFLREQIMQSPLIQLFDNTLVSIKNALEKGLEKLGDSICLNKEILEEKLNMNFFFIPIAQATETEGELPHLWRTGGKAHGLLSLYKSYSRQIPQGLVISPELYALHGDDLIDDKKIKTNFYKVLKAETDKITESRFGNEESPVLLSARSGAVFSMPGVMDTVTNIGLTPEVLHYYSNIDEWFAYDNWRRFLQDFALSVFGIERTAFEGLMGEAKRKAGVDLKEKMSGKDMADLAQRYKDIIEERGFHIPEDPYEQLFMAIMAVSRSWDSTVAENYRKFINISSHWGTSVIVQQMIFGNISPDSITGVVQSKNLGYKNMELFGEYKTRAQGYDIVGGVARVFPISETQKNQYEQYRNSESMEIRNPDLYQELCDVSQNIADIWNSDIEVEFTVENGRLFILQVRGITNQRFSTESLEESSEELKKNLIGQGLGASGGAVSGRAVFNIDHIDKVRGSHPDDKIILIRPDTSPEDVIGIKKADGILTSIGGMTSHAVLQMRRLQKSGVSDFSAMKIHEEENSAVVSIDSKVFKIVEGDFITIDGSSGHVFKGFHETSGDSCVTCY